MKSNYLVSVLIMLLGLSVSACHRPVQDQGPGAAQSGAAMPVPKRKPGLWRQSLTIGAGHDPRSSTLCLDEASDAQVSWWGRGGFRENCSTNMIARQDDGSWRFASVCDTAGDVRTETSGLITGDFERHYQLTAQVRISNAPTPDLNRINTIILDADWVGACPSGMAPGTMQLPSGRRINLLDIAPSL